MQIAIKLLLCFITLVRCDKLATTLLPKDYDRSFPPQINVKPVEVYISVSVLNLRSVKEKDLAFTVDLFIHQEWSDNRLNVSEFEDPDGLILHNNWRKKLWTPEISFVNGISGQLSTNMFPSSYFKIGLNQSVFMASRISVELFCEMNFYKYPHDKHQCNISLNSFAYDTSTTLLKWKDFELSSKLHNTDFIIEKIDMVDCTYTESKKSFPCISGRLSMVRTAAGIFTKRYAPTFMIVLSSFVGFWVPITSYPARVTLLVTSFLTLITHDLQTSQSLATSYIVCISMWSVICTGCVFLALIEFPLAILWDDKRAKVTDGPTKNKVDERAKVIFPTAFFSFVFIHFLYVVFA